MEKNLSLTDRQMESLKMQGKVPDKSLAITQEGVAIIPIQGTLMKKTSGLMALSGCTSYETLGQQIEQCLSSPQVKGVLLDIDSPGGEVSGLFDLADAFFNARTSGKPIYAVSNDSAFSAAYALASCADRIFLTRTAGVGSIGVFCCHVDQSEQDAMVGEKFTYVQAGAKKTNGNPHEPLSASALADLQAEVDREYQMFVELVARNRGISAKKVIETEAGCYFAENAIPLLADQIGTFEDALAALVAEIGASQTILGLNTNRAEGNSHMNKIEATATEETLIEAAVKADDYEMSPEQCAVPDQEDDDEDEEEDNDEEEPKKKEASADVKQILNLCKLAGVDITTASDFITNNFSVQQVIDTLSANRAARSNRTKVNTTVQNNVPTIEALHEKATEAASGDPKKAYANFKSLMRKNAAAYVAYQDAKADMVSTPAGRRKFVAELEAKFGTRS